MPVKQIADVSFGPITVARCAGLPAGEEKGAIFFLDSLSGGRARGRGLMTAFATDEDAPGVVRRALLEERLVMNATGPDAIRLEPPLTVSEDEIDDAVARLRALLEAA